ncbi:hypothetical protein SAMN05443637_10317 [Pseudonocardia thermophila]|jgi:Uncharacterized protein conserved in bacteria|uniref:DUF445 domain-containing protein n=1 Tax=Pseudonocardia thermophila TaxID=1848 RepID=A0A1M6Q0H5_PSETH|nr:hypothetical protein [Pseudonocardia thermophila]SHK13641.1 hypothetical protein SAMN05443637_10317 [Pseudonocardia thermophila]
MELAAIFPLVQAEGWVRHLSVPLFTGVIGWITNWTGVWMLFYPIRFKGVRVPGLKTLSHLLPRKVLEVPLGLTQGKIGWQGIIPSRAAKMGSIAVDKGLTKLGTPTEFYEQLDPNAIAEHILATSRAEIDSIVDRLMRTHYPVLWANVPAGVRAAIHARVEAQLPRIVYDLTREIGEHIDQLLDIKLMVIGHMEQDPTLANMIFQEMGRRELKLIVHLGFVFGFLLGIPLLLLTLAYPRWWVVPLCGALIGCTTNWLAIAVIFEPVRPVKLGLFTLQGLFLRRQRQVADVWAGIIAERIVSLNNIGYELFHGPRGDRTRKMIENLMRPFVDRAVGMARVPVRAAIGARAYDSMAQRVVSEAAAVASASFLDAEFNARQSERIRNLVAEKTRSMPPSDFAEMLRSAIKEDEWLLILHGAALGVFAGFAHLIVFGV